MKRPIQNAMSKREALGRYTLIINRLRKSPATFNQIEDYLKEQGELDGYNYAISKRTFQRDLFDIESMYGIEIGFDFKQKVYRIKQEDGEDANERVLEAFDTINAISTSERISQYIHFEKRRPQGTENFNGLLHAIRNKCVIKFTYRKFWDDDISDRTVEPYALKEYRNRWYIIAKDFKDGKLKNFGLDRITELDITKRHFKVNDFDENSHFHHCFGIMSPNAPEPSLVVLSFTPFQGKFIKSMPLHRSQRILIDNEEECRVSLKIFITIDFVMEVISHGDRVKVLEPTDLRDQVKSILKKALKNY
ncbi:helix-turn-helix transcriptional regulator [Perlabentimonas gracilis]|uniref:helix-turn-helix transcriptional regulator n=1 Tax=Perlabentimonas gracilis TaxID=2715279 RepID=UPI001C625777|nr:WYL domain-containing protein [Perlabentimonas gracilis]